LQYALSSAVEDGCATTRTRMANLWRIGCLEVAHYILLMTRCKPLLLVKFSDFILLARSF